jgi:hypothetical protein
MNTRRLHRFFRALDQWARESRPGRGDEAPEHPGA